MFLKIRLRLAFMRLKRDLITIKDKRFTPAEIMSDLFSKKLSLIRPWQYQSEFSQLLEYFYSLKATRVMEIGTANGGTLFAHCKLSSDSATIISVDLPDGKFGGGYPDWKTPIYKQFAKSNQKLHLIKASSHEQSTVKMVKGILNGELLDYLFIDGDHTYEGVKKDFDLYSPLTKSGGIIVFHDIALHKGSSCEVDKFWQDIKSNYKHLEFVQDKDYGQYGIGILIMP